MDQIADMLNRIKNAQKVGHLKVVIPTSGFKLALAKLLQKNGYIEEVKISSQNGKNFLVLKLKYLNGNPAIKGIKQISHQGQRIYTGKKEIPFVKNGFGLAIISTPQGVLTDQEARKKGVGGEVICEVW